MASAKTLFVQTGFGTVLGPMPEDALREMVRTGALVRADQVREWSDAEWHSAAETPGLFEPILDLPSTEPVVLAIEALLSLMPETSSQPTVTAPLPSVKGRLIPPPAPVMSALPNPSEPVVAVAPPNEVDLPVVARPSIAPLVGKIAVEPPSDEDQTTRSAPPEEDLISRWREERDRSREEMGTVSLAAEMTHSQDEDFAPELPADLFGDEDSSPPPVSVLTEQTTRRREIQRPAFLDQIPGLEDGPRPREEKLPQKWDRWRRSLPSRQIVASVIAVVFVLWWFWPQSSRGTYDRYVAIWNEWKTRRADLKDQSGWDQFLQRTEKELVATVPYLEKHARASDREKQLLLFVGRDCFQKMLKQPRQVDSPREKQLQILLAILHEFYEPSANGQSLEAVIASSGPPLKKSNSEKTDATIYSSGTQPTQQESLPPRPQSSEALPDKKPLSLRD